MEMLSLGILTMGFHLIALFNLVASAQSLSTAFSISEVGHQAQPEQESKLKSRFLFVVIG